jgi:hypothetical protein
MRATIIAAENEEGGAVVLQVNGARIVAMDCLGYGPYSYPQVGTEFEVEFRCLYPDEQDWTSLFNGNPEMAKRLERQGLWIYKALGQLVEVESDNNESAIADCGQCLLPVPIEVRDERCIGEYVSFSVSRLDAWRKNDASQVTPAKSLILKGSSE